VTCYGGSVEHTSDVVLDLQGLPRGVLGSDVYLPMRVTTVKKIRSSEDIVSLIDTGKISVDDQLQIKPSSMLVSERVIRSEFFSDVTLKLDVNFTPQVSLITGQKTILDIALPRQLSDDEFNDVFIEDAIPPQTSVNYHHVIEESSDNALFIRTDNLSTVKSTTSCLSCCIRTKTDDYNISNIRGQFDKRGSDSIGENVEMEFRCSRKCRSTFQQASSYPKSSCASHELDLLKHNLVKTTTGSTVSETSPLHNQGPRNSPKISQTDVNLQRNNPDQGIRTSTALHNSSILDRLNYAKDLKLKERLNTEGSHSAKRIVKRLRKTSSESDSGCQRYRSLLCLKRTRIGMTRRSSGGHRRYGSGSSTALQKKIKAARQLGVIMGAFTLCFFPYFVCFTIVAFCDWCVGPDLMTGVAWIGYINSTLNPFLFPLCNLKFRRKFREMLRLDSEPRSVGTVVSSGVRQPAYHVLSQHGP